MTAAAAQIAQDFTAMLKAGDHEGAAVKFNAAEIVSIEPMEGPRAVARGTEALKQKAEWWATNHEVHALTTEGPYVNGDQFIVKFWVDVTVKGSGQRMQMSETGLYTVKDGKIVEERFFYAM